MPATKTRIAIVGAGVAGLITARHLTTRPEDYHLVVFEQSDQVGGTWVYTDETEIDKNGLPVHSSMYKSLITNLPKEIMQIPDFPLNEDNELSFVHHSVIRQYLRNYTQHFNLYPRIRFSSVVRHIEPETSPGGQTTYSITYENAVKKEKHTEYFDVVVLCNGQFTVPHVPDIKGIDTFPGRCIHSHQFRMADKYIGRKVCILGASWSGIDIAIEVAKYSPKVYLSHNLETKLWTVVPDNIEPRRGIESIDGNWVIFRDGSTAYVDDLILCTGYKYTYPFLSDKIELSTDNNYVEPIYKQFIHTDMPNLFILGIPSMGIPFPMFHLQAQYIMKLLEGQIKLPSPQEMRMHMMREKRLLLDQGISPRHLTRLGDRQWEYYDELAATANITPLPPVIRKMLADVHQKRKHNFSTFKNYHYKILDRDNFSVCYRGICQDRKQHIENDF